MGLGQSKKVGEGLEGKSPGDSQKVETIGAEKAIMGVLHQNWDETQNWNWRKSMPTCFLMTVTKKEDLDRRRSAEELGGVEEGESVIRIMYEKKSTLNKRKSLNVRILYFPSLLLYQKALIKYHLKDSMPNFGVISE